MLSRPLRQADTMAQPSESDIEMVMSITGFSDRHIVTAALQAKNNNVEAVMNEYFDSPERVSVTDLLLLPALAC
jgi:hypothetical protein